MPKWEYKVESSSGGLPQRQFDGISAGGWELVSETVVRDFVRSVFKRPIPPKMEYMSKLAEMDHKDEDMMAFGQEGWILTAVVLVSRNSKPYLRLYFSRELSG